MPDFKQGGIWSIYIFKYCSRGNVVDGGRRSGEALGGRKQLPSHCHRSGKKWEPKFKERRDYTWPTFGRHFRIWASIDRWWGQRSSWGQFSNYLDEVKFIEFPTIVDHYLLLWNKRKWRCAGMLHKCSLALSFWYLLSISVLLLLQWWLWSSTHGETTLWIALLWKDARVSCLDDKRDDDAGQVKDWRSGLRGWG